MRGVACRRWYGLPAAADDGSGAPVFSGDFAVSVRRPGPLPSRGGRGAGSPARGRLRRSAGRDGEKSAALRCELEGSAALFPFSASWRRFGCSAEGSALRLCARAYELAVLGLSAAAGAGVKPVCSHPPARRLPVQPVLRRRGRTKVAARPEAGEGTEDGLWRTSPAPSR